MLYANKNQKRPFPVQGATVLSKFKAELIYTVSNPSFSRLSGKPRSKILNELPSRIAHSGLLLFSSRLLQGASKMDRHFQYVQYVPRMIDKD